MTERRDVKSRVLVDFDEVVGLEGIDPFNDLLCELTGEPHLQDISWAVLSASAGEVELLVEGYVEKEDEEDGKAEAGEGRVMCVVRFHPQAWQNDYAIPVDPEGPTDFKVPAAECVGLEADTYESDVLRDHENAPAWVQAWSGPFYIEILESA